MVEFLSDGGRDENSTVKPGQDVYRFNQNQIVQRRRIGNDHRHLLQSKPAVGLAVAFQIFESVFKLDAMLLEEAINLHAGLVAEQPPELGGGKLAFAVSFEGDGFQSSAGRVPPRSG